VRGFRRFLQNISYIPRPIINHSSKFCDARATFIELYTAAFRLQDPSTLLAPSLLKDIFLAPDYASTDATALRITRARHEAFHLISSQHSAANQYMRRSLRLEEERQQSQAPPSLPSLTPTPQSPSRSSLPPLPPQSQLSSMASNTQQPAPPAPGSLMPPRGHRTAPSFLPSTPRELR
jgi:hypothetical protein